VIRTPFIFSCGKISSGNKVVLRIFEQAGVNGWTVHGTPIQDGLGNDLPRAERRAWEYMLPYLREPSWRVLAVLPVRSESQRKDSLVRHEEHRWATLRWDDDWMLRRVIEHLLQYDVPFRAVSFESIMRDPVVEANELMEWASLAHRFDCGSLDWVVDQDLVRIESA
jgi:hypothetical protein